MFFPFERTRSSFFRSMIETNPSLSILAMSPVLSQPSFVNSSAVFSGRL